MTQTFTKSRRRLTDRSKKGMGVLWIALAMMIVVLTPRVWGQDNATITGNVADSSGADGRQCNGRFDEQCDRPGERDEVKHCGRLSRRKRR